MKKFLEKVLSNKMLMLTLLGAMLLYGIYINVRSSLPMPDDLRNRVVGSRVMSDGGSPYYYNWRMGDTLRYYDTPNHTDQIVSSATSTPFFHWVMGLVANMGQAEINIFWFVISYLALSMCCVFVVLAQPEPGRNKKYLLLFTTILFTYTTGWRFHINVGQNYIFVPALALGCYYCFTQKKDAFHIVLFGILAVSLVLLRPLALLLFLPFVFYFSRYFKWIVSGAIFLLGYTLFVLFSPVQKKNWQDYFSSVQIHIKLHQGLMAEAKKRELVNISAFEGIDIHSAINKKYVQEVKQDEERNNFFFFYEKHTGKKLSVTAMYAIAVISCVVLLLPLFLMWVKKIPVDTILLLLLGFVLYNTFEFLLPLVRYRYNFVQFIFPVLLIIKYLSKVSVLPLVLIVWGLWWNITSDFSIFMFHAKGQLMIIIAVLLVVYKPLILYVLKGKYFKPGKSISWV